MKHKGSQPNEELEEFDIGEDETEEEIDQFPEPSISVVDGQFRNSKVYIADHPSACSIHDQSFFGNFTSDKQLELDLMEALILQERKRIHIYDEQHHEMSFENIIAFAAKSDDRIWTKYLIYRDLRQRGYVVRMGFGDGMDFRVFPRGAQHQEDVAKYFICILPEGDPVQLETLDKITKQSIMARKELLLAIIDRLGDPTYYKLEQFKLTPNDKVKGAW